MPVNENKNHWILVIAFQKAKPAVSYDPLKTDFKRKASEINVFSELLWKKKSKYAFSIKEIRYSKLQEEAKYNWLRGICPGNDNGNSNKWNYIPFTDNY